MYKILNKSREEVTLLNLKLLEGLSTDFWRYSEEPKTEEEEGDSSLVGAKEETSNTK